MYLKFLDHGSPATRAAANVVVSIVLTLAVAIPTFAVAVHAFG